MKFQCNLSMAVFYLFHKYKMKGNLGRSRKRQEGMKRGVGISRHALGTTGQNNNKAGKNTKTKQTYLSHEDNHISKVK